MTKQQTIEFLRTQLLVTSGFYSIEQVLEMISKIEEEKLAPTMNRDMAMKIIKVAQGSVESSIRNTDWTDFSYDLELNGNEILLTDLDIPSSIFEDIIESELAEFFEQEFDIEL
jgi:hypothetical protein